MRTSLLLFFCFLSLAIKAQYVFPEKFIDCKGKEFSFEYDTPIAKIENKKLVNLIFQSLDDQAWDSIEGYLMLQVLVGLDGRSCLMSLENKTNIPSSQFSLKAIIDSELVWEKPTKPISAILLVVISKNGVAVKRFGSSAKGGWEPMGKK